MFRRQTFDDIRLGCDPWRTPPILVFDALVGDADIQRLPGLDAVIVPEVERFPDGSDMLACVTHRPIKSMCLRLCEMGAISDSDFCRATTHKGLYFDMFPVV